MIALVERGRAAQLAGELAGAGGPIDVAPGSAGAGLLAAALQSLTRAACTAAGPYRYAANWLGPVVVAPNGQPHTEEDVHGRGRREPV